MKDEEMITLKYIEKLAKWFIKSRDKYFSDNTQSPMFVLPWRSLYFVFTGNKTIVRQKSDNVVLGEFEWFEDGSFHKINTMPHYSYVMDYYEKYNDYNTNEDFVNFTNPILKKLDKDFRNVKTDYSGLVKIKERL